MGEGRSGGGAAGSAEEATEDGQEGDRRSQKDFDKENGVQEDGTGVEQA